ncbi:MAG: M42 family metallopeptidase [Actinobacteria bacterium]|nr:M42 family metallopeptidase [Actinomycetota bacterium]
MTEIDKLLEELMLIGAPSCYEKMMSDFIYNKIKNISDSIEIDKIGNLIAKINGSKPNPKKIMVSAHMDQLGLIVRRIDESGYIQFERLGGIPERLLPGTAFIILTEKGPIEAVCGVKSHHITLAHEKYEVKSYLELYLDIGAKSKEDAEQIGIEIGNPIIYKPSVYFLKNNRISGTSVDNRAACAILIKLLEILFKEKPEYEIYIVGSVREELNLKGASLAARKINPDISICLDGFIASDTPDSYGRTDVCLGKGPVLSMYNFHGRSTLNGLIPDKELSDLIKKTAKQKNIPLQLGALIGIVTESSYINLEGSGIKTADIAFPLRYSHSAIETCDYDDLQNLCKLIEELIKNPLINNL